MKVYSLIRMLGAVSAFLLASSFLFAWAGVVSAAPGDIVRCSITNGGMEPDFSCYEPAISADGRYVVFQSYASDLVPGDTNDHEDVFRKDLEVTILTTFYFAEGCTGPGFEKWLCLGNPVDASLAIKVTFLFNDGSHPQTVGYTVPGLSRVTVNVNDTVGPDREVSMRCEADFPFVAERPMYFNYQGRWTGGHDAVGASETSNPGISPRATPDRGSTSGYAS